MKLPRKILFISLLFDLVVIGVVTFFILRNNGGENVASSLFVNSVQSSSPVWIIMLPSVLIVIGMTIFLFVRAIFPQAIKNGVTAEATVLKVWDTGVSINGNPQVGILLEVHPNMAAAFQAETKKLMSRINPYAIQQGMTVQVIYDPKNLKRVEVTSIPNTYETSATPGMSQTELRLKELNNLREKGLISKDEYDKKREEILKNL
jgi:hypothetical protein